MQIKSVLYVTTQITGTWRYFSWCAYPNIWYARIQNKIINIGKENDKINFFIKFYPNDFLNNPNKDQFKSSGKCKMLNQSLVDILMSQDFDLIITEAVATTLLEILCTKSQILLFSPSDFLKINRDALDVLSKRVFIAESEDKYLEQSELLLSSNQTFQPKPINDEFLFKYGIGSPTSDPEKLAISSLNEICNNIKHDW